MEKNTLVQMAVDERVALVTINHPPANTLNLTTLDELTTTLHQAIADPLVKAIIITGAGKLFAAGADIGELAALRTRSTAQAYSRKGQALCALIENASKPVIAAINGRAALGGAYELALACHLRLAEESTEMGSPEVHLGLMVGWGGSQRLPRLAGRTKALELLLTGQRITAREAERIGLLNRVVPDGTVVAEALKMARKLSALSAPSLAATLAAVNAGLRDGPERGLAAEAEAFGTLCEKEDWREGTRAFLEKRKPQFRDR